MNDSKKKVYVETSVVSNLTARRSNNLIDSARQIITRSWWERAIVDFDLYASALVEREAEKGDPDAASLRISVLESLKRVPIFPEASILAQRLLSVTAVPQSSFDDAVHIATAAVAKMDYLVTWNCRHIANAVLLPKVYATCREANYPCPIICTPEQLCKGEWQ